MIKFLRWIAGLQPTSCNKRVPREEDPPSIRGYFPRVAVVHPTKKDMAALEHLKLKPGVVQRLQPGDLFSPAPVPASEHPWKREGWLHPDGGWCWYHHGQSMVCRARWHMVNPIVDFQVDDDGWLLPHYAIPVIPARMEASV